MRRFYWLVVPAVVAALALLVLTYSPYKLTASSSDTDRTAALETGQPSAAGAGSIAAQNAQSNGMPQGILVSGEGRVSAPPDIALLNLGVSAKASSMAQAMSQAQDAANKVINSLKGNGVQDRDIQTSQFSAYAEYDFRNGQQILTGYRVTHILSVKVRNMDRIGKVIDDAAAAGGDTFQAQGISFTIDDPTPQREQAREKAVADARAKAEQLARLTGVGLGRPIMISESISAAPPIPIAAPRAMESVAATPIQAGELEVIVNVQITYAIQ